MCSKTQFFLLSSPDQKPSLRARLRGVQFPVLRRSDDGHRRAVRANWDQTPQEQAAAGRQTAGGQHRKRRKRHPSSRRWNGHFRRWRWLSVRQRTDTCDTNARYENVVEFLGMNDVQYPFFLSSSGRGGDVLFLLGTVPRTTTDGRVRSRYQHG